LAGEAYAIGCDGQQSTSWEMYVNN
jgi:hypothetical protein